MRILVVGAGAIGGYYGGRMLAAGQDVTFLVRPQRAARLAKSGLAIKSPFGDVQLPAPPTVLARELKRPFDVVLLSCKAYDLDAAIADFAPAVGADTSVVPLLNGMRHLEVLDERLGAPRVLGGSCFISTRLDDADRIVHFNDIHQLIFGECDGSLSPRVQAIANAMSGAQFESRASREIIHEMWEKWFFLASLAGSTCLMRASVGDIAKSDAADLSLALLEECRAIATEAGYPPRADYIEKARTRLTAPGSPVTASMLGDIERGGRTEAEHILGDLLRRRTSAPTPDHSLLRIAYTALKAYEARQAREHTAQG